MIKGNVDIARELLLKWMACGERKRSYESIRKNCEYLDQAYGLGLDGYAMWVLFQPLFRTGVAEFTGKDCYALSPSVAIETLHIQQHSSTEGEQPHSVHRHLPDQEHKGH